jgi:hypothetical protein
MIRPAISLIALTAALSACVTAQTNKTEAVDDLPPVQAEIEMEAEETIGGPDYSLEAISPEPGAVKVGPGWQRSGEYCALLARPRGLGGAPIAGWRTCRIPL